MKDIQNHDAKIDAEVLPGDGPHGGEREQGLGRGVKRAKAQKGRNGMAMRC